MIDLIKGALAVGGTIFGGAAGASETRKIEKDLERRLQQNDDRFRRRYYEGATSRGDAQRLLRRTEETLSAANASARATAATAGLSPAGEAIAKNRATATLADAVSGVAAQGERRKDAIASQALAQENLLANQLNELRKFRRTQVAEALKGSLP